MRRPLFQAQTTALVVGLTLFAAGSFCLWDAYEGRGRPLPRLLRPFSWW